MKNESIFITLHNPHHITYSSPFKLGKDTITATCINKQNLLFTMKCKASVVASGGQSIASTKYRNEVLLVMHI